MSISFRELREHLSVDVATLRRLIREGLPCEGTRKKTFELEAVNRWLVEHGYAERTGAGGSRSDGQICRTYAELAQALGMTGSNPTRIIQRWATDPTWPGRPATPGKKDGHLPLIEIQQWLDARGRGGNGHAADEEITEMKRRITLLELRRKEREELLADEQLADVDVVAQFNAQCVANAKAILEPLPDIVVRLLPKRTTADTRRQVHADVTAALDDAYTEIARIVAGDDDEGGDDEVASSE